MIFFTELDHLPAFDAKGNPLGRLVDLGIAPSRSVFLVEEYVVRRPDRRLVAITHSQLQSISVQALQTRVLEGAVDVQPNESLIRLRKDVLDQQIIDVNQRKVVRVTDVIFDIEPTEQHAHLRAVAVDVGMGAGVRRLLQGVVAKHTLRTLSGIFPGQIIPWEFVNLIEVDPARRLRLRISNERLARLHPADLADILEELSREEQSAVIQSLDDETAAHTLSEVSPETLASVLESISAEKAADLVEEMPPDDAADALQSLAPEMSAQVLASMEEEEREDVRELLAFEEDTAGGMMTTHFVVLGETATVAHAVEAVRSFEGNLDLLTRVFVTDAHGVLTGSVALSRVLIADPAAPLASIAAPPAATAPVHADTRTVLDLFHKYNLLMLPVVGDDGRLVGLVTADDALDYAHR